MKSINKPMIKYRKALELILSPTYTLDLEIINILNANNRTLAEDVYAPISLPSYNNSAMDGYAVRSQETLNSTSNNPTWLQQVDSVAAGDEIEDSSYSKNNTIEIMTGAPVPDYFDAVIPVENILQAKGNEASSNIGIPQPFKVGANIRYKGEDIKQGDLLLSQGDQINSSRIMTLSGVGFNKIKVFKKIEILVLATGKELAVDRSLDEKFLINDCNSPFLEATLSDKYACNVTTDHILTDTDKEFIDFMQTKINSDQCPDVIISTGAVSAGKYDFIPRSLKKIGSKIIFHKVSIRPGKPILFAILPNGKFYFGLPGNPSAAVVGLRFFVYPLLRKLNQMPIEKPIYAKIDADLVLNKPLCFFQKAYHYIDDNGVSRVKILSGQASFMISPMLQTNAWVMLESAPLNLAKDALVRVYPI